MGLNSRLFVFALLMLPALLMLWPLVLGAPWRVAIRPTGEAGAIVLIAALAISPLKALFGARSWMRWLLRQRRAIGLAAFSYAALHMVVFSLSIGSVSDIIQGMAWASMWTGWLAFAALAILAAISNDRTVRAMGRGWKFVQRLAYPAALLTLAHWLLLTRDWTEALIWFVPLGLLQLARLAMSVRHNRNMDGRTAR